MVSCNFPRWGAYTERNPDAKEDTPVRSCTYTGDVDDLIFEDGWFISQR